LGNVDIPFIHSRYRLSLFSGKKRKERKQKKREEEEEDEEEEEEERNIDRGSKMSIRPDLRSFSSIFMIYEWPNNICRTRWHL